MSVHTPAPPPTLVARHKNQFGEYSIIIVFMDASEVNVLSSQAIVAVERNRAEYDLPHLATPTRHPKCVILPHPVLTAKITKYFLESMCT